MLDPPTAARIVRDAITRLAQTTTTAATERAKLEKAARGFQVQIARLTAAIPDGGSIPALVAKLKSVEAERQAVADQLAKLDGLAQVQARRRRSKRSSPRKYGTGEDSSNGTPFRRGRSCRSCSSRDSSSRRSGRTIRSAAWRQRRSSPANRRRAISAWFPTLYSIECADRNGPARASLRDG